MTENKEHTQILEEISEKITEINNDSIPSKIESLNFINPIANKAQDHIRKSQEDLRLAQLEIQEKIKAFDSITSNPSEISRESKRLSEQLDMERATN